MSCPMCPITVRDLSAVIYNLNNRLQSSGFSMCSVLKKFSSVVDSVSYLPADYSSEDATVQKLIDLARKVAGLKTIDELFAIKDEINSVVEEVQPLSNKHFSVCYERPKPYSAEWVDEATKNYE